MSKQYLYKVSLLNKNNKHPLDAISYYCGEKQFDLNNAKTYLSTSEDKVLWNNIVLPSKDSELYSHLPEFLKFKSLKKELLSNARNILWQNVFLREKRHDAQYARVFELPMPSFLSNDSCISILTKFAQYLSSEGMIVDVALHSDSSQERFSIFNTFDNKNKDYYGFLICTLRTYKDGQFVNKNRDWNNIFNMKSWRQKWLNMLKEEINNTETNENKNGWLDKINSFYQPQNNI